MISTVSAEVQKSRYKLGKTKWARNQTRPCLLMPEVEVAGGHWRVCDAPPPRHHWQHWHHWQHEELGAVRMRTDTAAADITPRTPQLLIISDSSTKVKTLHK